MRKIALVLTVMVVLGGGVALGEVPAVLNFTGSLSTGTGPYEGPANVTLAFYPDQTTATPLWSEQQEIYVQGGRFYVLLGTDPANPLPASLFDGEDLFLGIRVDDSPEITPRLRVTSVPYAMRAADAGLLGGLPPSAFSLEGHTHAFGDLTGQVAESQLPDSVVLEAELTDILGGYVTLETFNAALAGKSDVGHLHGIGDVTGLQEALDSKAAAGHDHDAAYVNVGEADSVTSAMVVDGTLTFADLEANGCVAGQVIKRGATAWECGDDQDTTYTAGTGLSLVGTEFSVVQGSIEDWARGVCYDTPGELQSALPGWDQDASNDLTTTTSFSGDVSGPYNNLQIAAGAVGSGEIADNTMFVSVRNVVGTEEFQVTDGNTAIRFSGSGAIKVTFDTDYHEVSVSADKTTIQNWAQEVCYDTPSELQAAVPGWDQDASNDLTTATTFGGDVSGPYNNLEIAAGTVGGAEIADSTVFASVQDEAGVEQFAVTDGSPGLRFVGAGATTVSFDPGTHQVTIESTDTNSGGTVTSVGLVMPSIDFAVGGSPITGSGTITVAWVNKPGNRVLASPDGFTGMPSFRALVAADIPLLDASKIATGTFSTDRFSAYADLVAEGKIGPGSGQVAAGDHNHDAAYVNVGEADSVTSAMVVNGTLQFEDIGANGCSTGQVMKRGASAWVCAADNDTTYTAGTGLALSPTNQFSVVQTTIEGWAKGVCYDTPQELQSALPTWDQDASNDLTTTTIFGGDVIGPYNNLQIAAGAVGSAEIENGTVGTADIADSTVFASVRNATGIEQFVVTDGNPGLRFAGSGATTVSFDPGTHQVTIASTGTVTSVGLSMPAQFTVSGSPVTTSGTLTATWTSQAANTVLAAPNGSNGAPGFRALVAADIPGLDASKIVSGTLSTDRFSAYADLQAESKIGTGAGQVAPGNHDHTTFWRIDGNAGTDPSTHYLGTSDNQALELRTNGKRALRLEPEANVVVGAFAVAATVHLGGWSNNTVTPGAVGATISGGGGSFDGVDWPNRVTDIFGTVGGGIGNLAGDDSGSLGSAWFATVGGGYHNSASGPGSFVGGGASNEAKGYATTVAGGAGNIADSGSATVGGGESNKASEAYATVGGGYANEASGYFATAGGGLSNEATGSRSFVGGGSHNSASGSNATVSGGQMNGAQGNSATVGGGNNNYATGHYATIPGGSQNWAGGDYSFAAGNNAWATNHGCFVWGDTTNDVVSCSMANQWVARASGGVYFYTSSDLSSGSYLPAGGSSWQTLSDRHQKTDLEPVDVGEVLECLAGMPITTWRYVSEESGARHMGPMAQDFYACYGLGDSERHISTIDADGVAFAAIQGLNQKVEALTMENSELRAHIETLATENSALRARVDRLERLLGLYLRSRDGRGR